MPNESVSSVSGSQQANQKPKRQRIQDEILAESKAKQSGNGVESAKKENSGEKSGEDAVSVKISSDNPSQKRVSIQQALLRDGADPLSTAKLKEKEAAKVESKEPEPKEPAPSPSKRKTIQQEIIDGQKKTDVVA